MARIVGLTIAPHRVVVVDLTLRLLAPELVDRDGHSDSIQPGIEARGSLEVGKVFVDLDEGLLDDVVGVLRALEHTECDGVDPSMVALEQQLEGAAIARLRASHEREVFGLGARVGTIVRRQRPRGIHALHRLPRRFGPAHRHSPV
jgi:hypothetical protein